MLPRIQPAPNFRIRILRWIFFVLGLVHSWQAILLWRLTPLLEQFRNTIPPQIRLLLAAVWALVWFSLWLLLIWQGAKHYRLIVTVFAVYLVYQLILLLMAESAVTRAGWPVVLFWGVMAVALAAWLGYERPNSKS
ncbi:MAG: hypothetical protein QNJ45_06885 [Ardenticatenaceae bacterium]|nr:hypothetical protein [Ardenticatenaceae bacterium]